MKILFVDQTPGHNPKTIFEQPTGGCLTSLTRVAEELVKLGHEVFVSSLYNTEEIINGVQYLHGSSTIVKWDVTIFNRNVLPKDFVLYCKEHGSKIIWWLHDIVDPRYLPDDAFTYVDHIIAQSNYCKNTYIDFYSLNANKFTVISNGIEDSIFNPGDYEKRNPNLYIMASAPIKGYAPIETFYINLKKLNFTLDFRIYSSQELHGIKNTSNQQFWLDQMAASGAHVYAPMSPTSLATVMKKAWCLLMPNSYPEMCSNLLLQARACGLPVVSSNIGSNTEWISNEETGMLTTKWHPHDIHAWSKEFAEQACRLFFERDLHKRISENTVTGIPTWRDIGGRWNELFNRIIN